MKHFAKRVTALLLTAVMSASLCITGFAIADEKEEDEIKTYSTSDTESVSFDIEYQQSKARESLQYVNEFRVTNDGYENSDGSHNNSTVGTRGDLTYDYALEELAMQRAAEIALSYSHTRPDGSSYSTVYGDYGYSASAYGECLYYTRNSSVSNAITVFEENGEDYNGQGHRRILLGANYDYTNYAMGCAYVDGYYYYAIEMCIPKSGANTNETTVLDGIKNVTVPVTDSEISVTSVDCSADAINVIYGEENSEALPTATATIKGSGVNITCDVTPVWYSNNTSVVTVDNNTQTMNFVGEGTATISADVLGQTVSFVVTIADDITVTYVPAVAPKCTIDGNIEYWMTTSTVYYDSREEIHYYRDEALTEEITYEETIIPATGHTFSGNENDLTWNWVGYESATASYVCTVCGETVTVDATITYADSDCSCTTDGTRTYTATVVINDKTYTDTKQTEIPAYGHDLSATFDWYEENGEMKCKAMITCSRGDVYEELDCIVTMTNSTTASCTTDGTATYVASIGYDGKTFESDPYTIITEQAYGHDYGAPILWNWSSDHSSCQAVFQCSRCGHEYTVDCEVTSDYKAPGCEIEGMYTYTAEIGQYSNSEFIYIEPLGHSWDDGVITKEPTCIDEGVRTYTCTRCGATYTESIPATGEHTWNSGIVTKEPTCEEPGIMTYTCTVCGATYTVEIPATGGHTWNSGVVTKEPTCTETGIMTYTCTKCGATETVTLDALGHNYTTNTVEPTCTEDGYTTHTCTRCGESYTDDYVSALGHDYQTQFNWSADYSSCTIIITCSRGDYNESFPCTVTKVITKQATCETVGETTYSATYNGLTQSITVTDIPAYDHNYSIDTFIWTDEYGHTWEYGGTQDEDFVWNENVTCKAYLTCLTCGKEFIVDCVITVEEGYNSRGELITNYTATIGDSDMYFTVTISGDKVIGASASNGQLSGEEAGDDSAAIANEALGDIISVSEEGVLDMPDSQPIDTNGGDIQTGQSIFTILGIACIPICAVWFVIDRVLAHNKKKKINAKLEEINSTDN